MNRLEVLSKDEILRIHEGSIDILEGTGIRILDESMLKILCNNGVDVDFESKLAKFPENLIKEALRSCPKRLTFLDRNKDNKFEVGGDSICIASGFYAPYVLKDGKVLPGAVEDVANFAKISNSLTNIDAVGLTVVPQDVPDNVSELYACDVMLNNTTKHLFFCPNTRFSAQGLLEMIKIVAEEEDLLNAQIATFQSSPTSPLSWESESIGVLTEASKSGIACNLLPEPMSGATSPITLASVLLAHNVEFLSGLVMAQIIRRGSPIIYGYSPTIFDMRTASAIIASPETITLRVAHSQIGRYYGLPIHCIAPDSDSHCHDEQQAWEKIITLFAALDSGANIIMNSGMFSTGLISSYEQLTIDDEIAGFILRVLRGIEVNEDTLAIDLIQKVGSKGHFLNQMHTVKHVRTEYWLPELSNRETYEKWRKNGGKDVMTKAKEKVEKILKEHRNLELDPEKRRKIKEVIEKYEKIKS